MGIAAGAVGGAALTSSTQEQHSGGARSCQQGQGRNVPQLGSGGMRAATVSSVSWMRRSAWRHAGSPSLGATSAKGGGAGVAALYPSSVAPPQLCRHSSIPAATQ